MYLNQKALWSPIIQKADNNLFGDIINKSRNTSINVRRQEHVEEIRTADGTIHRTNYIYYTYADVKVDDRLDGNLVVDSYDMRSLGGHLRLRRLKTV